MVEVQLFSQLINLFSCLFIIEFNCKKSSFNGKGTPALHLSTVIFPLNDVEFILEEILKQL